MPLPKEEKITSEEFLNITENNEKKCELADGVILNQAMPSIEHQVICAELYSIFRNFIKRNNGKCTPLPSVDAVFDEYNTVVPDFMVVCDKSKLDGKRCNGVPDMVIEVVSSNRADDFVRKLGLYMKSGVREYWIVDPKYRKSLVYFFEESDFPDIYAFDKPVPVKIYGGELEIKFSDLTDF